jgi:hypothetical protein
MKQAILIDPVTDENQDAEATDNHNVYTVTTLETQGFGQWCAACHSNPDDAVAGTGFHGAALTDPDVGDGTNWIRHPTAKLLTEDMATNYGEGLGAYDPTVPLEVTAASGLTGIDSTGLTLVDLDTTSQVGCLSCHKAHASDYADIARWDMGAASGAGDNCNKCHGIGD